MLHTHAERARFHFLLVSIFVSFFPPCTFTQHHHHHRHHQKPWSPWATFVIEALPTWRLAHSWTVLLLLRCRHNYRRIGDVVLPFWRASFLHGELHHDMQSHGQPWCGRKEREKVTRDGWEGWTEVRKNNI